MHDSLVAITVARGARSLGKRQLSPPAILVEKQVVPMRLKER